MAIFDIAVGVEELYFGGKFKFMGINMTLRDDLIQSKKLDAKLSMDIAFLEASIGDNEPLFDISFYANKEPQVTGFSLRRTFNDSFAGMDISLKNLKELVDNPAIAHIDGQRTHFPPGTLLPDFLE